MRFLMATHTYIIFIPLLFILVNNSVNIFNEVYAFFPFGNSQDEFKPYENTNLKLSIQYPSSGKKKNG